MRELLGENPTEGHAQDVHLFVLERVEHQLKRTGEAGHPLRPAIPKNSRVGRLQIRMVLSGEWESIRRFIYDVESASEFVIIDDVILAQNDPGKPLTLTLELSTYFRLGANGN